MNGFIITTSGLCGNSRQWRFHSQHILVAGNVLEYTALKKNYLIVSCSFSTRLKSTPTPWHLFGRCLQPHEVMYQLKYRYDREIDLAQRLVLKLIKMSIFVSNTFYLNHRNRIVRRQNRVN